MAHVEAKGDRGGGGTARRPAARLAAACHLGYPRSSGPCRATTLPPALAPLAGAAGRAARQRRRRGERRGEGGLAALAALAAVAATPRCGGDVRGAAAAPVARRLWLCDGRLGRGALAGGAGRLAGKQAAEARAGGAAERVGGGEDLGRHLRERLQVGERELVQRVLAWLGQGRLVHAEQLLVEPAAEVRLVRRRLAVQLHHLPVDEAAEEEDRVELEQLLHREQLLALRQRERRQLRQVVPPAPVQVQVPLPDGEHAPQGVPRVARQLSAHLERLARREDAAQRVPPPLSRRRPHRHVRPPVEARALPPHVEDERLVHLLEGGNLPRRDLQPDPDRRAVLDSVGGGGALCAPPPRALQRRVQRDRGARPREVDGLARLRDEPQVEGERAEQPRRVARRLRLALRTALLLRRRRRLRASPRASASEVREARHRAERAPRVLPGSR
mmetsp:Transcript_32691/g.105063  ORF Transcript_32691/g.105063 Transcript_32691/m.105063 type:complete len:445 (+) Transcript_32691:1416-2750(+)